MKYHPDYVKEKQDFILREKKRLSPEAFEKFLNWRFRELYHLDGQRQILEPLGIPIEKYCCKDCALKEMMS